MGVDFDCLLDVAISDRDILSLPEAVFSLPARLDALFPDLTAIWQDTESAPNPYRDKLWRLDIEPGIGPDALQLALAGPYGFGGVVMQHALNIWHLQRWKFFVADEFGLRSRLTACCHLLAKALGARRIVYLPDLGVEMLLEENIQTFDEMLIRLQQRYGPPAAWDRAYTINDACSEMYFVERAPL